MSPANAESMNLSFGSFGRQNTLGGLIDNVSLAQVSQSAKVPEPATIIIFALALGLISLRKQKKI